MNIWNSFFNRPIEVFSATSANEAAELLDDHEDDFSSPISTCPAPWTV